MTSKGQVTIPKDVRRSMGLRPGDRLEFRVRPDGVVELLPQARDLRAIFGIIKSSVRGVELEDMDRAVREGASGE